MDQDGWRAFLKRWSEEWIAAHDPERDPPLDEEIVRDGWLGFSPAVPDEVAAAESRLGRALPPSYREFLLVTNGWRHAGTFIWKLGGTTGIAWMRDADEHWIESYDEFFQISEGRNVLEDALQISLEGDAAVLFLDPEDVGPDGEWAACFLASWADGPRRFASFYDLMYDLYAGFHALRRPPGTTRDRWEAAIEQARQAALNGEIDEPLRTLQEADRFGNERAKLLRYQLLALMGDHRIALTHLLGNDNWIIDDPIFVAELLPVLYAAHRDQPAWQRGGLRFFMTHASGRFTVAVAEHEAETHDPDHRPRFGVPEFDERVHTVLDGLTTTPAGDAWTALLDAMAFWRPVSEHHIAPVVLLSDARLAELITPERGRELLAVPRARRHDGRDDPR